MWKKRRDGTLFYMWAGRSASPNAIEGKPAHSALQLLSNYYLRNDTINKLRIFLFSANHKTPPVAMLRMLRLWGERVAGTNTVTHRWQTKQGRRATAERLELSHARAVVSLHHPQLTKKATPPSLHGASPPHQPSHAGWSFYVRHGCSHPIMGCNVVAGRVHWGR